MTEWLPFPNLTADFDPKAPFPPQAHTVDFALQTPYMIQYNLSVQRSLPGSLDVTLAYAGSRGNHLIRIGEANLAPAIIVNGVKTYQPQLGRINPNFSPINRRVTDAQSFYNSMQINVAKRFSKGLGGQAAYTFSRSVDDSSGINSQDFTNVTQSGLDFYDRTIDRGLSAFHVKHNLTFNWTYDLPFAREMTGVAGALFKGWQLNNITGLRSGAPFTVRLGFNRSQNLNTSGPFLSERPNLKPGYSNNPVMGDPNRYWDINAFELPAPGTRGTLGRNTLIGPKMVSVDFSLAKSFRLGENRALQFRAEVFNLPNHPNFATPTGRTAFANAVCPDPRTPCSESEKVPVRASDVGKISSTATTSRQIQFGLKLTF